MKDGWFNWDCSYRLDSHICDLLWIRFNFETREEFQPIQFKGQVHPLRTIF